MSFRPAGRLVWTQEVRLQGWGGRIASGTAIESNAWSDCRGILNISPFLSNRISRQSLHALLYLLYPYSRPAGRNDSSLKSLKQPVMTCSKVSPVLLLIAILINKCAIVTRYNSGGFIDRQVIKVSFGDVTFLVCFFINGYRKNFLVDQQSNFQFIHFILKWMN